MYFNSFCRPSKYASSWYNRHVCILPIRRMCSTWAKINIHSRQNQSRYLNPKLSNNPPFRTFIFGSTHQRPQRHQERKLLRYPVWLVYRVVSSVEYYDQFVPWCVGARILKRKPHYIEAELAVGFHLFSERYVSKVYLDESHNHKRVVAHANTTQLFHYLTNEWMMQPTTLPRQTTEQALTPESAAILSAQEEGCWLSFRVEFAFRSSMYAQASGMFLDQVVHRMVHAFEHRCAQEWQNAIKNGELVKRYAPSVSQNDTQVNEFNTKSHVDSNEANIPKQIERTEITQPLETSQGAHSTKEYNRENQSSHPVTFASESATKSKNAACAQGSWPSTTMLQMGGGGSIGVLGLPKHSSAHQYLGSQLHKSVEYDRASNNRVRHPTHPHKSACPTRKSDTRTTHPSPTAQPSHPLNVHRSSRHDESIMQPDMKTLQARQDRYTPQFTTDYSEIKSQVFRSSLRAPQQAQSSRYRSPPIIPRTRSWW